MVLKRALSRIDPKEIASHRAPTCKNATTLTDESPPRGRRTVAWGVNPRADLEAAEVADVTARFSDIRERPRSFRFVVKLLEGAAALTPASYC